MFLVLCITYPDRLDGISKTFELNFIVMENCERNNFVE